MNASCFFSRKLRSGLGLSGDRRRCTSPSRPARRRGALRRGRKSMKSMRLQEDAAVAGAGCKLSLGHRSGPLHRAWNKAGGAPGSQAGGTGAALPAFSQRLRVRCPNEDANTVRQTLHKSFGLRVALKLGATRKGGPC